MQSCYKKPVNPKPAPPLSTALPDNSSKTSSSVIHLFTPAWLLCHRPLRVLFCCGPQPCGEWKITQAWFIRHFSWQGNFSTEIHPIIWSVCNCYNAVHSSEWNLRRAAAINRSFACPSPYGYCCATTNCCFLVAPPNQLTELSCWPWFCGTKEMAILKRTKICHKISKLQINLLSGWKNSRVDFSLKPGHIKINAMGLSNQQSIL